MTTLGPLRPSLTQDQYLSITAARQSSNSGENVMAFVNEYIPAEDFDKYGLAEIDSKFLATGVKSRTWTIDRDREIYLRHVAAGRDELSGVSTWNLYWKGNLLWFKQQGLAHRGSPGTPCWAHIKVSKFDIPEPLRIHRDEIYQDLRDAFMAYRDGGVFATSTEYSMQLDIEA
jgi:hypothetical protein